MGLFITGVSGFIGRRLLGDLAAASSGLVYGLSRSPALECDSLGPGLSFRAVQGGVFDVETYGPYLKACDTVVHLGAVTGKAKAEDFFQVNAKGTGVLLDQCKAAGVKNFLFVSTIAVTYPNKDGYHYANSKERAEQLVRESGLRYLILRPTIVVGKRGGAWEGLQRLSKLPILLLLGNGNNRVQPIYVDDVVKVMVDVLQSDRFHSDICEVGGPDCLTMEALLRRMHVLEGGSPHKAILRIPLGLLRRSLSLCEKIFGARLPITVGQLSAFANDGVPQGNDLWARHRPHMVGIDSMIRMASSCEG